MDAVAGPTPASPLDLPLAWTEFPNRWAKSKTERCSSLRELAKRIEQTVGQTKDDLPWLKLALFGDEPRSQNSGCLRHNANMLAINGIELDYDDGDLTWDHAWARLYKARLPALLYTTRRHTTENPRFRVLLPTSRSLSPAERAKLVARAYGVLRGAIDGASFTASQSFYFGCIESGQIWLELVEPPTGRCIDEADELDAGALGKNGRPWSGEIIDPLDSDDEDNDDEFGELLCEPDIDWIKDRLEVIPSDEREVWLRVGQALHHEFAGAEDGFELWNTWSQSSEKHDEHDQRRVWNSLGSFVGKPCTIGSLEFLANELGPSRISSGELTFHTPAECSAMPTREYVWKHMLARGDIASIFGAPGAGKSTAGPHIAYMVARGETAFQMRTRPGVVFYVAAEDPMGLRQRVSALMRRHGDAPNFLVVGGLSNLFDNDSGDLAALTSAVERHSPVLVVIDTLSMAFPGLEENDAKSMARVVTVSRQLAAQGAAVVLIHHDTKAEGSTPRGHSVLNGALDMAIHLRRDESGTVRGRLTKNRNGSPDRDIAFKITAEVLGSDEDGEQVTAPLVEELTGAHAGRLKRLPASQEEALKILQELEAGGVVTNEQWASVCSEGYRVSQSEKAKLRRDAFSRARRELRRAELIVVDHDGIVRSKSPLEDETCSEIDGD